MSFVSLSSSIPRALDFGDASDLLERHSGIVWDPGRFAVLMLRLIFTDLMN